MADLQELFSRLKAQSNETSQQSQSSQQSGLWTQQQNQPHQQPSVSSPLISPPSHTPNPHHASNILSPVNPSSNAGTPAPDLNRTNNLLNLLKFNGQTGQQQQQQQTQPGAMAGLTNVGNRHASVQIPPSLARDAATPRAEARPLSAADVMANLQRSASGTVPTYAGLTPGVEEPRSKSSGNPQDFLLNLLKGPAKAQTPSAEAPSQPATLGAKSVRVQPDVDDLAKQFGQTSVESTASQPTPHPREATPARQFGSPAAATTPFDAPSGNKASMFSYVNPFDQLHSSSPLNRNRTPQPTEQAAAAPRKLEILKHDRSASSANGEAGRPSSKSRKIDDDTSSAETTSVSQKLEGLGEKVEKQVEQALKAADSKEPLSSKHTTDDERIKKETANNEDVESSWESAEDEKAGYKVEVYNFPMKPFVSLQLKSPKSIRPIRQDNFMVIAQLKKEFDQVDRCLVTASTSHIVYAQVATKKDNGGFRIIRQDSGDHKQVFRSSGERIFSVQICNSPEGNDVEAVLGTGVNGAVFWTSLSKSRGEMFPDDDVEGQGFIMPPVATVEENTSGSPVKTRAKISSRHPDFFAIARGKHIHIISPETAREDDYYDSTTHRVNTEKYLAEHSLKLNTGKAGKDFCFSEDDSVIVSLDKNGRFKFWDIRDLTARASGHLSEKHAPIELKEPLWQMIAATSGSKPDEKPSVSSVMFLDKDRPVSKGSALRYVLIGFKQNHILQLWDLGLGKAVQEIRLPHEKDSDGICSLTYHPKTGVLAIGHPTRNSIYFIHLSAPKYNIPLMEQARYISMLAKHDPALPKPESTAILSGLREFSFAKVGQLRSLEMLRTPVENAGEKGTSEETLFELYVMHSKGVVGISVKRDDLGWDAHGKMLNPKDALKEGVIEVNELILPPKQPSSTERSEQSSNADTASKQGPKQTPIKKEEPAKAPTPTPAPTKRAIVRSVSPAQANGTSRLTSPEPPSKPLPQIPTNPPLMTADSYSLGQRAKSPLNNASGDEAAPQRTILSPRAQAAKTQAVSASTQASAPIAEAGDYQALLSKQFDSLYQRIDSEKRVSDAAAGAKQDALLRLVSSTLTDNVDRSLSSIIANRIEKDVIPTLTEVTSKVVDRKITESLPPQLNASVSAAMKANLSNTLRQALTDKEVHKAISEITANQVAQRVQQQVSALLQQQLPEMTTQAAQKMVKDLEGKFANHQRQAEAQRQQDNAKIEELSGIVRSLSTTLQGMANSQNAFQEQILKMQRDSRSAKEDTTRSNVSSVTGSREPETEPEDAEIADMTRMLMESKYEEATIAVSPPHNVVYSAN